MALPLEGKVAVVTGSSRGIGKAIALQLAEDGADVVICARSDDKDPNPLGTIARTASEVVAKGRRALPVKLDVTSDGDIRPMVERVMLEFGHIDILVNNAALMGSVAPDFWAARRTRSTPTTGPTCARPPCLRSSSRRQ